MPATAATNTSKTYLLYKADGSSAYAKLTDITSAPALQTAPPKIDATTLSDTQHVYIPDIADTDDMTFGANYDKESYVRLKALEGKQIEYELRYGDKGEHGRFQWTGDIFTTTTASEVGAVRGMELTMYPSTEIVFVEEEAEAIE